MCYQNVAEDDQALTVSDSVKDHRTELQLGSRRMLTVPAVLVEPLQPNWIVVSVPMNTTDCNRCLPNSDSLLSAQSTVRNLSLGSAWPSGDQLHEAERQLCMLTKSDRSLTVRDCSLMDRVTIEGVSRLSDSTHAPTAPVCYLPSVSRSSRELPASSGLCKSPFQNYAPLLNESATNRDSNKFLLAASDTGKAGIHVIDRPVTMPPASLHSMEPAIGLIPVQSRRSSMCEGGKTAVGSAASDPATMMHWFGTELTHARTPHFSQPAATASPPMGTTLLSLTSLLKPEGHKGTTPHHTHAAPPFGIADGATAGGAVARPASLSKASDGKALDPQAQGCYNASSVKQPSLHELLAVALMQHLSSSKQKSTSSNSAHQSGLSGQDDPTRRLSLGPHSVPQVMHISSAQAQSGPDNTKAQLPNAYQPPPNRLPAFISSPSTGREREQHQDEFGAPSPMKNGLRPKSINTSPSKQAPAAMSLVDLLLPTQEASGKGGHVSPHQKQSSHSTVCNDIHDPYSAGVHSQQAVPAAPVAFDASMRAPRAPIHGPRVTEASHSDKSSQASAGHGMELQFLQSLAHIVANRFVDSESVDAGQHASAQLKSGLESRMNAVPAVRRHSTGNQVDPRLKQQGYESKVRRHSVMEMLGLSVQDALPPLKRQRCDVGHEAHSVWQAEMNRQVQRWDSGAVPQLMDSHKSVQFLDLTESVGFPGLPPALSQGPARLQVKNEQVFSTTGGARAGSIGEGRKESYIGDLGVIDDKVVSFPQHFNAGEGLTVEVESPTFGSDPNSLQMSPSSAKTDKGSPGSVYCEHNRIKCVCRECGGGSICPHRRVRSKCKECGGGSICAHNRVRSQCKECKGGSICVHGRQRTYCKACGGGSVCEHGRARSKCKDCGGGSICEHNKVRSKCKLCGGGSICEHGKRRSECKPCGGGSICEHNRVRSKCKDCGGGAICLHNKVRSKCKDCKGGSICPHRRQRWQCKDCNGKGICEHQRVRSVCKECRGGGICQHNKVRSQCKECKAAAAAAKVAGAPGSAAGQPGATLSAGPDSGLTAE